MEILLGQETRALIAPRRLFGLFARKGKGERKHVLVKCLAERGALDPLDSLLNRFDARL